MKGNPHRPLSSARCRTGHRAVATLGHSEAKEVEDSQQHMTGEVVLYLRCNGVPLAALCAPFISEVLGLDLYVIKCQVEKSTWNTRDMTRELALR